MTMVTYRISSGTVRKHLGKPVRQGKAEATSVLRWSWLAGRGRNQAQLNLSCQHLKLPHPCPHPACLSLLWPQSRSPRPHHKPWGGSLNLLWSDVLQGCPKHLPEMGPSDPSSSSLRGTSWVPDLRGETILALEIFGRNLAFLP